MNALADPMTCLEQHVPLSLLADLLCADGPDSREILRAEGGDTAWLPRSRTAA